MSTVPFAGMRAGSPADSARFFRTMRNACAVPTRLAAYLVLWAWLAGRIVAMSAITIGLGFSGAMAQSGGTAPDVSGHVATVTGPDLSDTVFDSGFFRVGGDANAASVPLMGTTDAADGARIEARWVAFNDTTDVATGAVGTWQSAGTASGGAWSGTLTAPRNIYSYYRPEVRVAGSASAPTLGPHRFVVGHVFAVWGQSNTIRTLGAFQGEQTVPDPVIDPRALRVWIPDRTVSPHVPELFFVNDENAGNGGEPIKAPQVVMSNMLAVARPGERFAYASHIQSGAPVPDVQDDTITTRLWSDEVVLHNALTGDGVTRVGFAVSAAWGGMALAMATGKDADGSPFTRGQPDPISGVTINYFWTDLYGTDEVTRVAALQTGNNFGVFDPWLAYTDNPAFPEMLPLQQYTYGAANDGHYVTNVPGAEYGSMLQSARLVTEIMVRTGLITSHVAPEITDWDYTSEAYFEAWHPDFDITTAAEVRGDTFDGVLGFTLNGVDVPAAQAQLVDNAGGSGRRGIRITPPGGVTASDTIAFGLTDPIGYSGSVTEDAVNAAKSLPVMLTSGPPAVAMPIVPRITFVNNLPQPLFFTRPQEAPGLLVDPNSFGAGVTGLTVQALVRLRLAEGGGGTLFDQAARGMFNLNQGSGSFTLNWKTGGSGSTSQVSFWSDGEAEAIVPGVWTTITMTIDLSPSAGFDDGYARVWSDKEGLGLHAYEIAGLPGADTTFDGSRALRVMDIPGLDVRFLRIWKAATTSAVSETPDTTALGTPYKAFTSDADGNMVQTPLLPSW
jgi:hypothetical protein